MTQEEKAKRYDEALEMARKCLDKKRDTCFVRPDVIFPELAESEDEMIRRAIIHFISHAPTVPKGIIGKKTMLDWLEKHKPVEHLELKEGHWYVCYKAYCCREDSLTVREGERFMCEKDGVVKGFFIKDAEKYFKECNAPTPYEDEQKPKWSEKDEKILKHLMH